MMMNVKRFCFIVLNFQKKSFGSAEFCYVSFRMTIDKRFEKEKMLYFALFVWTLLKRAETTSSCSKALEYI